MNDLRQKKPLRDTRDTPPGSFRFTLQRYAGPGSRYTCPQCHKARQLTRYVDTETGKQLGDDVGKCNRAKKCGYHLPPKAFFERNPEQRSQFSEDYNQHTPKVRTLPPRARPSTHSEQYVGQTIRPDFYSLNNFFHFLKTQFGEDKARSLCTAYQVGTAGHFNGGTIFWQIAYDLTTRAGKIMLYDPATGKRKKGYQNWIHALLKKSGQIDAFNLEQCLFGEHLLRMVPFTKPVAVVESEKTAIIMAGLLPDFIWLATGGLYNLTARKIKPLVGRPVVLFPDAGCLDDWQAVADKLTRFGLKAEVSDYLETHTTEEEKEQGLDVADFFTQRATDQPATTP